MGNISGLYDKRLSVGKKTPMGKACKLVYNSAYGKFAQSIGEPIFGNPVYASLTTAGCRTLILKAIGTHPKGLADVSMVATDAVFFRTPHPGLSISQRLGEWDHTVRLNLTQFKPGVYWDDDARRAIRNGENPHFKARGFAAADFADSIGRIDAEFDRWTNSNEQSSLGSDSWEWPSVKFVPNFSLTTALQALRQHEWNRAGLVATNKTLIQNSNPSEKRTGLYRDGDVFRTRPYFGLASRDDGKQITLQPIPSNPYTKRFGMEDPWSDDAKEQYGVTEDGNLLDILAWLIKGE